MRAKGLGQERAGSIASRATTNPGTRLRPWPLHRGDCRNNLLADWHRENADVSRPRETASLLAHARDANWGKAISKLRLHALTTVAARTYRGELDSRPITVLNSAP